MVDLSALLIFAVALTMAAGSPGPSITALVARVLARGWRDVAPFLAAMWIGEAIWLTCAIAGLATLAETFYWAFVAIKYLGVCYLLYLAWRMWIAPVPEEGEEITARGRGAVGMFATGLAVTLGNPKIMVFYLALLPTIINIHAVSLGGWAALTVTMLAVLIVIDVAYVVLAARARRFLRSPRATRIANRISATAVGGAAALIAAR